MKLLSFVIPTYNFGNFIGATLDSILCEDDAYYEIIVFDGYSTDNTEEILKSYVEQHRSIKYVRSKVRANIDVDLNMAIQEANGEYIWTLSADDLLTSGWLGVVLSAIREKQSDIFLLPAIHCNFQMVPYRKYHILRRESQSDVSVNINDSREFISYLDNIRTSEGLFSFCSACLVKSSKILSTESLDDANGTCWRYAVRLIQAALTFPTSITILGTFLVRKRGDNDSFIKDGVVRRMGIAVCQWTRAVKALNIRHDIERAILDLVHSDISFLSLLYAGQFASSRLERGLYVNCVNQKYYRNDLASRLARKCLSMMPELFVLRLTLSAAKKAAQGIRKSYYRRRLQLH
jgi:glycosyltransferase involved in cell wall biosynthesis